MSWTLVFLTTPHTEPFTATSRTGTAAKVTAK